MNNKGRLFWDIFKSLSIYLLLSLVSPLLFGVEVVDVKIVNDDLNKKIEEYNQKLRIGGERRIEFEKGKESGEVDANLERIAVFDVGSTGVKFKVADVDPRTNKIVKSLYETTKNTEHLGFDINESNYMDRIAVMAGLKAIVEEYYPKAEGIDYEAVATAGFRKAGEKGVRLAQMIAEMVGINFKIIDQDDEGLLAYYGVKAKVNDFNQAKDLVWDIGGGSSQIVLSENVDGKEELKFYGVEIGGNRFNEFVRRLVKQFSEEDIKKGLSVNPMTKDEVNEAMELAKFLLTEPQVVKEFGGKVFSRNDLEVIRGKIAEGGKVYVIGAVHNFIAKMYADKIAGDSKRVFYTKEDIKKAIELSTGRTDDEIFNGIKGGKGEMKFVKGDVTSLILVYSMMDVLGIDKVYPVNASNTDGLIIKTVMEKTDKAGGPLVERSLDPSSFSLVL